MTEEEERLSSTASGLDERNYTPRASEVCEEKGFTLVRRGSRKGPVLTSRKNPPGEEVNNRFSQIGRAHV